ncbi:MAG: hypothetical protein IT270_19690, partial [Saprospiraceae bacterium]|nr:hypothetical protein [Saprospiraceae bacterium]
MESKPDLDKLMQGRLYEHSVAPPAFVWTNIDKELRKRRQRKGFFWLLFALGLTASGL